jgi:transcriptional regulator with PAS, ATPase and Fis domain
MVNAQVYDHMVGDCPAMRSLFATIEKVAPTDLTVLVVGETGTGKELVARSLHAHSPRARGPFVALNCAAIPATLLESELFGFVRGAFTGAERNRVGTIERAHGGTLFLDEIAEMLPGAQAKLLRVLQDRRVRPLGATQDRQVDVRVVAATHQDLQALVAGKAFRADLYHRLNEITLALPPLRERGDDVERIAEHILARLGGETRRPLHLSAAARRLLHDHAWPGNVRELENCLRRAVACRDAPEIDADDLRLSGSLTPLRLQEILDLATEAALREALRRHAGGVAAAAGELDVPVQELRDMAARFRIRLDET